MGDSTCCIYECENRTVGQFLCSKHYTRLRRYGNTNPRPRPAKKCRMIQCGGAHYGLGFCGKHYQRIYNNGSPFDKDQSWIIGNHRECLGCGDAFEPQYALRKYCSVGCRTFYTRHGVRPKSVACAQCGDPIDMTARSESGSRKSRNTKMCKGCARAVNLSRFVPILLERDGSDCGICGHAIDMDIRDRQPQSRSVDHILPRSLGGDEEITNLRLAHLICNIKRQNRIDYVAA